MRISIHIFIDMIGALLSIPGFATSKKRRTDFVVLSSPLLGLRRIIFTATQKLLSVGIQLLLYESPGTSFSAHTTARPRRSGRMFLRFGTRSEINGLFEHPSLLWTDGHGLSHGLQLLNIQSIRPASSPELKDTYPVANPARSFFVTTHNNAHDHSEDGVNDNGTTSSLFEAVDKLQMIRVTAALRGIIGRLAKKIIMGENDWMIEMMLARSSLPSSGGGANSRVIGVPCAMTDVTDHLVKRTALMKDAHERRRKIRSTRQAM